MATFESKNFIIDLVKQLNLNNMDDATRARLDDLNKKNVATKDQASWKPGKEKDLPKINATDESGAYKYGGTEEPKSDDLSDLYKKLILVLRELAADKDLSIANPVKDFLKDFYGDGKAVEIYKIDELEGDNAKDIANYISANLSDYTDFFEGTIKEKDLKSLIEKLNKDTYVSDANALKTLDTFLKVINHHYRWGSDKPLPEAKMPDCLVSDDGMGGKILDGLKIDGIRKKLKNPKIPSSLNNFEADLPKLFNKLVANEKLFEKFQSKDSEGDISNWISKGIDKTNYKSGKNALTPKYDDRKQFWDRAKSNIQDFYVDTLGKLEQKHTRHIYKTNARHIVPALIKKGVKPTDGTEKLLSTLDVINGSLPNPVQEQVKWIKETMSKMKDMNFFKDALRDGDQMLVLVSEIIKAAAHEEPNKEKEAEVALEMLAVMRYTMFTSSVRDQLKQTEFKLLSDGNLSFNKGNKFMQSMTKALDSTLKFGMMATFEIANLTKNAIKQHGLRYGKGTDKLDERITKSVDYEDKEKRKTMERLFDFWNTVNSSANTKDYNPFKSHKKVQQEADAKDEGTVTVKLAGEDTELEHKTKMQKRFLEHLLNNNTGRAA